MPIGSKTKIPLNSKTYLFGLIILLLALAMAAAIYLKQQSVTPDIAFWKVLLWQLVLWLPLVLILPIFQWVLSKYSSAGTRILFAFLAIGLHYLWFAGMSSLISPYLDYPRTRYGVYPFFFIFWTLIDIFLVSGLILYLLSQQKKKEDPETLKD